MTVIKTKTFVFDNLGLGLPEGVVIHGVQKWIQTGQGVIEPTFLTVQINGEEVFNLRGQTDDLSSDAMRQVQDLAKRTKEYLSKQ